MKHNKLLQYIWSYPLKTYIVKPMFKSQALSVLMSFTSGVTIFKHHIYLYLAYKATQGKFQLLNKIFLHCFRQ